MHSLRGFIFQILHYMKTILIATLVALISITGTTGQDITLADDGLYYTTQGDLFTGEYREKHPDGQLKTLMPLTEGKIDGKVQIYFADGTLHEQRSYRKGVMHGTWITWNTKGQKLAEAQYEMGQKHGKWYVWNEQGTLLYDMTYAEGKRTGIWKMYDETGKLVQEMAFE